MADVEAKKKRVEQTVQQMRGLMSKTGNQAGWEEAWKHGLTPWEMMLGSVAQPALRWACEEDGRLSEIVPRQGKAIVPGCGRGQDVAYLAHRGLHAVGVDISSSAVKAAREWLAGQKDDGGALQRAQVIQADYFDLQGNQGPGKNLLLSQVDLVYDYTFFCAIPPELHTKWADANAAAIKSGGILLCLVYPLKPVGDEVHQAPDVGPPFLVAPEMYKALLQDRFTLEFEGVPPVLTEHNKGRQMVMVWRRK